MVGRPPSFAEGRANQSLDQVDERIFMSLLARSMAISAMSVSLASAVVSAQTKSAPLDQTGLEIGANAPRFTLTDQEGQRRILDDLLKSGKVALVFYRSADW
jgi:cytochrome oxidase Cu insertion factor (SCO1/SenC/PrrC family)